MSGTIENIKPGSAVEWYDLGCLFRRRGEFGQAVNAFRAAIEDARERMRNTDDAAVLEELSAVKEKAETSIGLVLRITGFVNKDLMNP